MEATVDLDIVEEFVTSSEFSNFLVSNLVNFGDAAFILQVLLDGIKKFRNKN